MWQTLSYRLLCTWFLILPCAAQGYNIRYNSVSPATIFTALWEAMLGKEPKTQHEMIKKIDRGLPLGRMENLMM
jgi:3(or 17)beta-hydroxysteroid dehydrogenase